jgi:hypothetical protein
MKRINTPSASAIVLTVLWAALAAVVQTGRAQVTFQQVTNALVDWYPLDIVVTNGTTLTTPDHLNGRDLVLSPGMTAANVVRSTRPSVNSASVKNCLNLNQTGSATVLYYNSKGQDPLTTRGGILRPTLLLGVRVAETHPGFFAAAISTPG